LDLADEGQLLYEDPLELEAVQRCDVSIGIWAQENTKALSGTDPKRQALVSQGRRSYVNRFLQRASDGSLRWTGTQFPCQSSAQDAQMSLAAYEDFVFSAGKLASQDPAAEWRKISQQQQRVVDCLNRAREVRFTTSAGTDLTVGVEGRQWINCDGHENFPDGEVFTGPIEDATQGVVFYSFPAVHGGRECDGIRL
ncbi:MAG: aminopeptidase, partial [Thermoguttaceae bacterium]